MKTIGSIVDEVVPSAMEIVLKESGIEISPLSKNESHFDVIAVIGFSGEGFGGALGFAAQQSILEAKHNKSSDRLSDGWIGEIANQLLGRLKNALLNYGIDFQIAIPMVLHGLNLQISGRLEEIKEYSFRSKLGDTCVWVDANWDTTQECKTVEAKQLAKAEGDMLLF